MSLKIEEARLRRSARRQGLILSKTRRRDPRAFDHDRYVLLAEDTRYPVHAGSSVGRSIYSLTLEDVQEYLEGAE